MASFSGDAEARRAEVAVPSLQFKRLYKMVILRTNGETTCLVYLGEYLDSRWEQKETVVTKGDLALTPESKGC